VKWGGGSGVAVLPLYAYANGVQGAEVALEHALMSANTELAMNSAKKDFCHGNNERSWKMLKHVFVIGAIVVLVCPGAQAHRNLTSNFDASVGNTVWRGVGQGRSVGVNGAFVGQQQGGHVGGVSAQQNAFALLGQGAVAWGGRGRSGVRQTGSTEGEQHQRIGHTGFSVEQTQGSGTSLGQTVGKAGGGAGAAGVNVALVHLNQGATAGPGRAGGQRQTTVIIQDALVQGGPGSIGRVLQNATVNATQSQNF